MLLAGPEGERPADRYSLYSQLVAMFLSSVEMLYVVSSDEAMAEAMGKVCAASRGEAPETRCGYSRGRRWAMALCLGRLRRVSNSAQNDCGPPVAGRGPSPPLKRRTRVLHCWPGRLSFEP